MTRVLVTGGAGYIGSHTVLALLDAGWQPVVLDDLSTGRRDLVPDGVPFCLGDANDDALVRRTLSEHGCEAVMHFAGSIIVPESVDKPAEYYRNNAVSSLTLINACVETGVRCFVFSSTAAVYGMPDQPLVSETAPTQPINPYGWSKLMTERMLMDIARATGLKWAILRYFNVAGADPERRAGQAGPNSTHLIKIACEAALGKRPEVVIYGDDYDTPDGTCVRDYIHVSDLAEAHVKALSHLMDGADDMLLNCGYGRGFSVRQVLDAVISESGRAFDTRVGERRAGDAETLVSDARRIRSLLDWRPRHDDLAEIVGTALRWERGLDG